MLVSFNKSEILPLFAGVINQASRSICFYSPVLEKVKKKLSNVSEDIE